MNIWEVDKLQLFLSLFIPGFLIIKVYDILFPNCSRDFSKAWFDAVAFSSLHYGIAYMFVVMMGYSQVVPTASMVFIWIVLLPVVYPVLFLGLVKSGLFHRFFIHPIQRPWDYFFSKGEVYWLLVHLKNGTKIAGKYDRNSFVSSYPELPEILIEEIWVINDKDELVEPIQPKRGAIILNSDISRVEFYIWGDTKKDERGEINDNDEKN
ncbi:DUF6338 family protein [Anaerospora sp.]|uniref:DUF6338 family protein n=1 Tax=Anaerospora sp. TaxID=1960278 RepID=UPI00289D7382|nr:DUF6338 family protein [Anaerospora sp.]